MALDAAMPLVIRAALVPPELARVELGVTLNPAPLATRTAPDPAVPPLRPIAASARAGAEATKTLGAKPRIASPRWSTREDTLRKFP